MRCAKLTLERAFRVLASIPPRFRPIILGALFYDFSAYFNHYHMSVRCRFGVGSGWLGVMIKCEVIRRHSRIFWTKLHSWSSLSYCIFFITQLGGSEPGGQSNPIQLVKLQEFSLCQLIILRAWKTENDYFWDLCDMACGSFTMWEWHFIRSPVTAQFSLVPPGRQWPVRSVQFQPPR